MSDELLSIQARHAEDDAEGPFVGRRSEQARQDRAWLIAEIARLRLTDAEREALIVIESAYGRVDVDECRPLAATLRGLLERLK